MVVDSGLNMSLCVVVVVESFLLRNFTPSVTFVLLFGFLTPLRTLMLGDRPARWLLELIASEFFLVIS